MPSLFNLIVVVTHLWLLERPCQWSDLGFFLKKVYKMPFYGQRFSFFWINWHHFLNSEIRFLFSRYEPSYIKTEKGHILSFYTSNLVSLWFLCALLEKNF